MVSSAAPEKFDVSKQKTTVIEIVTQTAKEKRFGGGLHIQKIS